ncbi:hypothetical protein PM082_017386 [Marasmius tenuissimus]|nr:hypothetical protein PM082_017386 [Marasmius tenuissimus]
MGPSDTHPAQGGQIRLVIAILVISTIFHQKHSAFERVAHIYDPSSEQSFFVNVSLLLSRSQAILSGSSVESSEESNVDQTIYVSLASDGSPNPKISSIPQEIVAVLRHLAIAMQIRHTSVDTASDECPSTIALPTELLFDVMVPLAGFILEYPVALSPTPVSGSDMSAFLSQVPLHVYECALDLDTDTAGSRRHLLMKFSIPSVLASVHPFIFSPSIVTSKLETKLKSRLEQAFSGSVPSLTVVYNTVTLDRVAL